MPCTLIPTPDPPHHAVPQQQVKTGTPGYFCQCVSWVQCANLTCMKWRRLGDQVDPWLLPEDWSCDQNMDGVYDRCDVAEERCSGDGSDIIYAQYVPGCIVWVKQHGHPWWPAIVDYDPDTQKYFQFAKSEDHLPSRYHVTFLGEFVSRAWVSRCYLKPFQLFMTDGKEKVKTARIRWELDLSIGMAHSALSMGITDRLQKFGFPARYIKGEKKDEGDESHVTQLSDESSCNFLHVKSEDTEGNFILRAGKRLVKRKDATCCSGTDHCRKNLKRNMTP